jgi:hypothetical protein
MNHRDTGRAIASVLTRSWRQEPPEPTFTATQLEAVAPILQRTGAGGLAWWRVRGSALGDATAARSLKAAHGRNAFRAGLHEAAVAEAVERLRSAGIRSIVVKGVGVSRLYPSKGLRQPGDIDLGVPRGCDGKASAALEGRRFVAVPIDLSHAEFEVLAQGDFSAAFDRCDVIDVAGADVRVPCAEDRLRYLCVHFLRHYGYRPLWLCDVAAALESAAPGFDWERSLGEDPRVASWVRAAVGLARELVAAEIPAGAPAFERPPKWISDEVLRIWGVGEAHVRDWSLLSDAPIGSVLRTSSLRRPVEPLRALRARWPSAFVYTIASGRPFARRRPVLPRVGVSLRRAARCLAPDSRG